MATLCIQTVIDTSPLQPVQRRVVGLVLLAMVLEGFDIQLAAFAAPAIRAEWGLRPIDFGPALAAVMVGMALGGIIGGWLGDRWGRRPVLVGAVAFFGLVTIATAFATDLTQLTALRLIGGLGFGAAYPNATVLVGEWTPLRLRARAITTLTMGMPIGGLLGAALCSYLIPSIGWRHTFIFAGSLPVAVALAMFFLLPESLIYLSRFGQRHAVIRRALAGFLRRPLSDEDRIVGTEREMDGAADPAARRDSIFARHNWRVTAGIWIGFLGNVAVAYLLLNWLPMLLTMLGVDQANAIRGSLYLNLAGLVGLVMSALLYQRFGSRLAILSLMVPAAAAIIVVGLMTWLQAETAPGSAAFIVLAGACIAFWGLSGTQACLWSLCVHAYSIETRSTGLGWGNSIGRLGAISSTLIGGILLGLQPSPLIFLLFVAGALLLAAGGILVVDRHAPPVRAQQRRERELAAG